MSESPSRSSVTVSDPRSMRALAHPLRLKLLGILRTDGPRSVGQLADLVDQAPGTVSYHIGTLATFGFVVEAPELARDGREHWWRSAHESTEFHPAELRDDPERQGASVAMRQAFLQSYLAEQLEALAGEAILDRDWLAASTGGDSILHLGLDDYRAFAAEVDALTRRWEERGRSAADDTRAVRWIYNAFLRP